MARLFDGFKLSHVLKCKHYIHSDSPGRVVLIVSFDLKVASLTVTAQHECVKSITLFMIFLVPFYLDHEHPAGD